MEKRFSAGLQLLGTYVYSKSIDDSSVACGCTTWLGGATSLQDPNRRYLERSLSQYDIPHVFQVSYVYQIPFGRNKRFGGSIHPALDAVIGGVANEWYLAVRQWHASFAVRQQLSSSAELWRAASKPDRTTDPQ